MAKHNRANHSTEAVVKLPTSSSDVSANWKKLLQKIPKEERTVSSCKRRNRRKMAERNSLSSLENGKQQKKRLEIPKDQQNSLGCVMYSHYGKLQSKFDFDYSRFQLPTHALAIDCEMVGVGDCKQSALARVSIVNEHSFCIYDRFVKPLEKVTDYRTQHSGIREEDLKDGHDHSKTMEEVAELIKGKILIGHSIKHDLNSLFLKHPRHKIRDTAVYYKKAGKTPSLKGLTEQLLNAKIQEGEHSSIVDAQAAMKLYLISRKRWEDSLQQKYKRFCNT